MGLLLVLVLGWAQGALAEDIPPKVKLISPSNHSVFAAPANITLEATASDKDGTIKRVQFFSGSHRLATIKRAPYTFTWTGVKAGKYTLTAVATDNRGVKTASHEVHIVVDILPSVTLTSPVNGASFKAPATIPLTSTAKDPDGKITKVDFFQGANLIASVTALPYAFTLSNVQAGNYSFTAVATDNRGQTTTSNAVNVVVNPGVAQVYYIYTDQLNTPRAITNQQNQVVWRWNNNDPFGANVPDEDPDGDGVRFTCNLRFPGQYFDKETNTYYNYFRDYDPATGRYVESDPIGLAAGPNTYDYAYNNPLSFFDREGLDAIVTFFPGVPGHIGIGVNTTDTVGLYPKGQSERLQILWLNACRTVPGIIARDRGRQSPSSMALSESVRIKTLQYQDRLMLERIQASQKTGPQYNLCIDQCTSFVVEVLTAGGVGGPPDVITRPRVLFDWIKDTYGRSQ